MKKLNVFCAVLAAVAVVGGGVYYKYTKDTEDVTPPDIRLETDSITLSVTDPPARLLEGVSAIDDHNGDLTKDVQVNDIRLVSSEPGKLSEFEVSYVVFDTSNNMAYKTRDLTYSDYVAPRFKITSPLRFSSIAGVDLYRCIGAEDSIEGDISSQITVSMGEEFLEATSAGIYSCNVQVANSLGDYAELPLTFEVYDSASPEEATRPVIYLSKYLTYIKTGEYFDPQSFLESLRIEKTNYKLLNHGDIEISDTVTQYDYGYFSSIYGYFLFKDEVKISTDLDVNTPGIYTVEYTFRHPTERTRGSANLLVVVEP